MHLYTIIELIGFIFPALVFTCLSRLASPLIGEVVLYITLISYFVAHKIGIPYKWKTYKNNQSADA